MAALFLLIASLCALRLSIAHGRTASEKDVVVETPLGAILGRDEGKYQVFRGIPYAEPPQRFVHAVDKAPWNGTLNASFFRDACVGATAWSGLYDVSEDCLHANVWTPGISKDLLPVVVFIPGGGFMFGTGSDPSYWGDVFVRDPLTPVVYVSFNYRLSILGFLSDETVGANFGFTDQQVLLRWVNKNIASFGGDPNRVTLMGQSAGAMSVQTHLVTPSSFPYYQRAYISSTVGLHYRNMSENAPFVHSTAQAVGCLHFLTRKVDIDCLRQRSARELVHAADITGYIFHLRTPCDDCDNFLPWLPVVDGSILTKRPLELLRSGNYHQVPTVFSSTRNESFFFMPMILKEVVDINLAYTLTLEVLFPGNEAKVKEHYGNTSDSKSMDDFRRVALMVTDALFTCYSRYLARLLSGESARPPVYLTQFMHAPSSHASPGTMTECREGATCHAADLDFIFTHGPESERLLPFQYTGEEVLLSASISEAVRRFAHNKSSFWVPYTAKEDESLQWWSPEPEVVTNYHKDHCDFIESIGFDNIWNVPAPRVAGLTSVFI